MQFVKQQPRTYSLSINLLLLSTLALSGCNSGNSQSDSDTTALYKASANPAVKKDSQEQDYLILEGVAMKGVVSSGIVSVHGIEQHAGYYQISEEPLSSPVRTQQDGSFKVRIESSALPATLVVKISADQQTRIVCDVTAGCETADGVLQHFGAQFSAPDEFVMYSAARRRGDGQAQQVYVTPLTHLAYKWAENQGSGLTPENITLGRQQIALILDFPPELLDTAPLDITKLSSYSSMDSATLNHSILIASFQALANSPNWRDVSEVLAAASERFGSTGRLASVNLGGLPEVSKSDILFAAADLAEDLSQMHGGDTTTGQMESIDPVGQTPAPAQSETEAPSTPVEHSEPDLAQAPAPSAQPVQTAPSAPTVESPASVEPQTSEAPPAPAESPTQVEAEPPSEQQTPVESQVPTEAPEPNAGDNRSTPIEDPSPTKDHSDGNLGDVLDEIANEAGQAADDLITNAPDVEPVQITFNPTSIDIYINESATLNVNAIGSAPIHYQWRKNGVAIPGATYEHLSIPTATLADTGVYDCIISNEAGSVSSLPATLNVQQASLTLNWTTPTQRVDGSPLDANDLKGYRIIYGTASTDLSNSVQINDPYATEYRFEQLTPASYYFAIIAVDVEGNESELSSVVGKDF